MLPIFKITVFKSKTSNYHKTFKDQPIASAAFTEKPVEDALADIETDSTWHWYHKYSITDFQKFVKPDYDWKPTVLLGRSEL